MTGWENLNNPIVQSPQEDSLCQYAAVVLTNVTHSAMPYLRVSSFL